MKYQWHFEVVWESLPFLLSGVGVTIALTVCSMGLALVAGLGLCLARLSRHAMLRMAAVAYVDFVRSTPLLVQVLWIYYGLALATEIVLPAFAAGVVGLALNISAYAAEIFRSGVTSVEKGQGEAAAALGMTGFQAFRRIIFPQAFRRVIPSLASMWVSAFKDTSVVSIIGVSELLFRAQVLSIDTYRPVEIYTALAVIYFSITYPQARIVDRLFHRVRVR